MQLRHRHADHGARPALHAGDSDSRFLRVVLHPGDARVLLEIFPWHGTVLCANGLAALADVAAAGDGIWNLRRAGLSNRRGTARWNLRTAGGADDAFAQLVSDAF